MYVVRIPAWFKKLNKNLVWNIDTKNKELYLTFDDGPHETATPFVLDQLKKYNAKATFFCLGKNVKQHPEIYTRILNEEHAVGNHTFNHLNGFKTKRSIYIDDVEQAAQFINSKLFRPPYGRITPFTSKVLHKNYGYTIIMWEVLSGDFDITISPEKALANVADKASEGSIIVFHDSAKALTALSYALPKVLEIFTEQGFVFKSLPQ
jgi:peptidoglycan-N-acetylglucosamine deacetylase